MGLQSYFIENTINCNLFQVFYFDNLFKVENFLGNVLIFKNFNYFNFPRIDWINFIKSIKYLN